MCANIFDSWLIIGWSDSEQVTFTAGVDLSTRSTSREIAAGWHRSDLPLNRAIIGIGWEFKSN